MVALLVLSPVGDKIAEGARVQVRERAVYTTGYFRIKYPGGDLPRTKGVCTDVVIRALRHAGFDLQVLIHEDMKSNFSKYPQKYGLKKPDTNIDHRRVPNQITFFSRYGLTLTKKTSPQNLQDWKPGDIVYWKLPSGLDHCGIVVADKGASGMPLVVHNLGYTAAEDCLSKWTITGHFRYPKR